MKYRNQYTFSGTKQYYPFQVKVTYLIEVETKNCCGLDKIIMQNVLDQIGRNTIESLKSFSDVKELKIKEPTRKEGK